MEKLILSLLYLTVSIGLTGFSVSFLSVPIGLGLILIAQITLLIGSIYLIKECKRNLFNE